jgi:hypothetical protein
MGTSLSDQRLLALALDHLGDGGGTLEMREIRFEHSIVVPEACGRIAASRVDSGPPPVHEPQNRHMVLQLEYAALERG